MSALALRCSITFCPKLTSTLSLDTVINNFNQSLDSISQISSDSEEEDNVNDDIPGLQHFLDLLREGKLEISKEVFTDLSNLISKIDEVLSLIHI